MLPRVQGKPYEADCEWVLSTKHSSGEAATSITSGMVARDSAGRRLEQQEIIKSEGADEREVWTANIYDPVSQAIHYIDLRWCTTLMSLPLTTGLDDHGIEVATVEIEGRSAQLTVDLPQSADGKLGEQMIEGMNCTGYWRTVGGYKIEYWIAEELEATIRSRIIAGDRETTTRIYNILRSEPDPQLFVVPPPDPRSQVNGTLFTENSGLLISISPPVSS